MTCLALRGQQQSSDSHALLRLFRQPTDHVLQRGLPLPYSARSLNSHARWSVLSASLMASFAVKSSDVGILIFPG